MSLPTTRIAKLAGSGPTLPNREILGSLREKFLADPRNTDLSILRPVIARSWQRSSLYQVSNRQAIGAVAEPQLDEQFLSVATPVLDELERICLDVNGCVSLSDAMGTMALFRGAPTMVRLADRVFPTIGGCMSEDLIGTNSDGTAIEEGCAVQTWGSEHFNEALQDSYCTSVPIVDPLRGSIRGVLSVSLPEHVAITVDPRSILLLVHGAAAEVTRSLAARLAAREQALLSEYLREVRKRGAEAVVAMDGQTTIVNRGASQLLDQADFAVLAAYAQEAGKLDRPMEHEIRRGGDEVLQLRVRPVTTGDSTGGTVMRLRKFSVATPILAGAGPVARVPAISGLIGESLSLRRAVEIAGTAAAGGLPAYILGEPGTGKLHLARALAGRLAPQQAEYDCNRLDPDTGAAVAERLAAGHAIIVRHAELLPAALRDLLIESIAGGARRLVLTLKKLTDDVIPLIEALQGVEIQMQPLRVRREDIPPLIRHFLESLEKPRRASPSLIELLAAAEWPGNAAQLREVVEAAALRAGGSEVRAEDISEVHRRALARSRLSRLQIAELEQISEALREARGNRLRAAAILRIGRSTLYRKLDFYTDCGFEFALNS